MARKYTVLQDVIFSTIFYTLSLAVIVAIVAAIVVPIMFTVKISGFQSGPALGTDPTLVQIFTNTMTAYNNAITQVAKMGVGSTPIEGTTLDKYLENQLTVLQGLAQTCSATVCTDAQIKDPSLLDAYTKANAAGGLGLPDITFDTLAAPADAGAADATQAPDTQLPPAQMPASVLTQGSQPSLDDCKKYYTCSVSATMIQPSA